MKFLEKLKARKLSKALAAVAAGGMLMFGSSAMAAPANNDAGFAFRQAYVSTVNRDRAFNQIINFFGPTFRAELNSNGQILRDASMRMAGKMNWGYTNLETKNTTNFDIPFYVSQTGNNEMTVFVQRNGKWNKFALPGLSIGIANAVKSNDVNVLEKNLEAVKDVKFFSNTDAKQIFNVTLDGKYLGKLIQKYDSDKSNIPADMLKEHGDFVRNMTNALNSTDLICTWAFDKKSNEVLSVSVDLTDLMRAYGKSVLDESAAGKIVLSKEERDLMETIGYYGELHFLISYIGVNQANQNYSPSADAQKAVNNPKILNDIFADMTTTVEAKK